MKPVFQVLFGLIIVVTIGAVILSLSVDSIVRSNIESTTSEMLETTVKVDDVAISILNGEGSIEGITIYNPEGFSENPAVKLQQISLTVDPYSLLSDTVIVKEVRIKEPELYFEQKVKGSNLNTLSSKLKEGSSSGTRAVIDYLLVEDGRVTLTTEIGGEKSVEGTFSKIEIEGIGRDGNNTMEQVLSQILKPILEEAAQEAIRQGVKDKARDAVEDLLDS
ncbi:DUF748 domain-containing protein [Fodinibius halophilus]|uniref:AsmA family protein n=1 Tax=Fodinibius halophilus TaxID=1736908 RepID=A0A6M1SZI8_9BACT|nr:AsmA family protein [Fodinibius halophilus]NGP87067.1 hypothetical protein [Fodinibius halophilus]